ncbi:hypothetical protein F5888DRAFT_1632553 [Russula emetica]|nr:hypothetical protein F5888DRAFT_1632553 [Russula emetica]
MANGVQFRSSEDQDKPETGFLRMRDTHKWIVEMKDEDGQEPSVPPSTANLIKVMQQPCKDLLATLPVELLYEIHLFAASEALPLTCRRLYDVFKNASPAVHADYLIARHIQSPSCLRPNIITYVLRFPLCTPSVLAALLERPSFPHPVQSSSTNTDTHHTDTRTSHPNPPELPRRLFRQLSTSGAEALPHLHFLYTSSAPQLNTPRRPIIDSYNGYPLVRAASACAIPLVRFLLDHGASPRRRDALAIRIAIKRRDLSLVRLLIDPADAPPDERRTGKRRKLADRVKVTSEMLRLAVTCGARDIAEYLMNEKGCVPDLITLSLLSVNF